MERRKCKHSISYLFSLLCFSLLHPHSSLSLCLIILPSLFHLSFHPAPQSPLHIAYNQFFFMSLSLALQIGSRGKVISVRSQRSRKAECELRKSVKTNDTKKKRLISCSSQKCSSGGKKPNWCRTAELFNKRSMSTVHITMII